MKRRRRASGAVYVAWWAHLSHSKSLRKQRGRLRTARASETWRLEARVDARVKEIVHLALDSTAKGSE